MSAPTGSPQPNRAPRRWAGRHVAVLAAAVVVVLVGAVVAVTQLPSGDRATTTAATRTGATAAAAQAAGRPQLATMPAARDQEYTAWVDRVSGWLDIPRRAMRSYAAATVTLNREQPGCHMSWVTLAGIGKQTTDHGRAGGGVRPDGSTVRPIHHLVLRDFFGKAVSNASASGPMQLTPALWRDFGARATGRGAADRENFDDAVLTTGRALCAGGRDLADGGAWWSAVGKVNDAPLFLHRVLATATVYGTVAQSPAPPKPAPLHAVEYAISKIGLPYVWGGNGKGGNDFGGFDCSGLTTAAYAAQGIELRRMADWQFRDAPRVPPGQAPQLGDLVFFGNPAVKIHHVGIYIGNHQMVDAPTFGQAVQVHIYHKPGDDFAGAGRVVS